MQKGLVLDGVSLATDTGSLIDGRYRIDSLIGRGGMADVYRAVDESLQRTVAIKLFRRSAADPDDLRREASEVNLLASLNHHSLVTVFDAHVATSVENECAYLVMELVDGENLHTRLGRGPVDRNDAAAMAFDIAEGLHVVHSHGVVHRDIKPANVLLTASHLPDREFSAKLADFGIAYLIDSIGLTATGAIIGTAAYLSPEQARGERPGAAADVYSLGLVLLEALTGVRAFPGSMVESVSARIAADPEIPAFIGSEWKSLLTAMTARDAGSRPTALEVALTARSLQQSSAYSLSSTPSPTQAPTTPLRTTEPLAAEITAQMDSTQAITTEEVDFVGDQDRQSETREPNRSQRRVYLWAIVVVAALILAVAVILLISTLSTADVTTPALPHLEDPLGRHMKQLLESVVP